MNDIDWSELPSAALALARIVTAWRSHLEHAESCRARAAEIRSGAVPAPLGLAAAEWAQAPTLLEAQAQRWDASAAGDVEEFREGVAKMVAAGRLTRAQTAQFSAVTTVAEAHAAVTALKRELF